MDFQLGHRSERKRLQPFTFQRPTLRSCNSIALPEPAEGSDVIRLAHHLHHPSRSINTFKQAVARASRPSWMLLVSHSDPLSFLDPLTMASDEEWLKWVEGQFRSITGEDALLDPVAFKKALRVKDDFLSNRFFSLFDLDQSGRLSLEELMTGLNILIHGSQKLKLKFLFDVYDEDGNGSLDFDELHKALYVCKDESSLTMSDDDLQRLTQLLFNAVDKDGSGTVEFEEFYNVLEEKYPIILGNLTLSVCTWLKPPKKATRGLICGRLTWKHLTNNFPVIWFVAIFFLINLCLFVAIGFKHLQGGANWFYAVARASGMCLNFDCSFVVVVMLRFTLTLIRSSPIGEYLPVDNSVTLHRLVGYSIVCHTFVHTMGHLGHIVLTVDTPPGNTSNNTVLTDSDKLHAAALNLFTLESGIGWAIPGFAYLSGVILAIILAVMFVCSLSCVRRGGHFEVFYWTHFLYAPFWLLLILHCPNFWYFFVVPGLVFIIEKIYTSPPIRLARLGRTYIKEANLLPSKVSHLVISRPENFYYRPGDYIFINIPQIASYEWHPFSISSAPEMEDELWLHVRSAGHWTNKLYQFIQGGGGASSLEVDDLEAGGSSFTAIPDDMAEPNSLTNGVPAAVDRQFTSLSDIRSGNQINDKSVSRNAGSSKGTSSLKPVYGGVHTSSATTLQGRPSSASSTKSNRSTKRKSNIRKPAKTSFTDLKIRVEIQGPFGTASREIFDSEHAVLVAAGIGVTPFASILQSIMYRYVATKKICPNCHHGWYEQLPDHSMKLKRVDFIWVNRDQKSFEWFIALLTQLEKQQAEVGEDFLHMRLYLTAAASENDIKGLCLQLALDLMRSKENKDLITGLKTKTHCGRPDWNEVFQYIDQNKKGKVKLFFCGSPPMAKILKQKCMQFGFRFAKEQF